MNKGLLDYYTKRIAEEIKEDINNQPGTSPEINAETIAQYTNQEAKDVEDYTEEERKLPLSTKIVVETLLELAESITANTGDIGKIQNQVGNFDAALDAAIALCDSYIGGETE